MLNQQLIQQRHQAGTSLVEVLVTVVILAFGLLGVAGLEMKTRSVEMESYQRGQAMVILNDMVSRFQMSRAKAADYLTGEGAVVGEGDVEVCDADMTSAEFDLCEWGNALRGAGETLDGSKVGAMIGARGCITEIQAPDATPGTCAPGIYEITVTWQGMFKSKAPKSSCAEGMYGSGDDGDALRRAISLQVSAGTGSCI